jgi:hypothetical protein
MQLAQAHEQARELELRRGILRRVPNCAVEVIHRTPIVVRCRERAAARKREAGVLGRELEGAVQRAGGLVGLLDRQEGVPQQPVGLDVRRLVLGRRRSGRGLGVWRGWMASKA